MECAAEAGRHRRVRAGGHRAHGRRRAGFRAALNVLVSKQAVAFAVKGAMTRSPAWACGGSGEQRARIHDVGTEPDFQKSPRASKAGPWYKIGTKFSAPPSEVHQDHDLGTPIVGSRCFLCTPSVSNQT